jgi:D-aminopeptidase
MTKTDYLTVEVASQRGYTQVKVNDSTDYKANLNSFRNAHTIDLLAVRIELLKLLRMWDESVSDEYEEK